MSDPDSTYRAALRVPDFRRLVVGSGASQMGDWLYNVAFLVYVFDATGSAQWVGLATIGRLVPYVIFSPLGGVIADRYDRMRVMIATDLARAVLMAGLAASAMLDASAPVVIGLAFVATAAGTPNRPAALAALPDIVGETRLAPANALLHMVQDVGVVLGPAVGSLILIVGSAELAFGLNAVTFLVSAIFTAMISVHSRGVKVDAEAPPSALALLVDGLRAARSTPYVVIMTTIIFIGAFTYGAQTVQLLIYADERLGLKADGYGYLLGAMGLGGVLGGALSNRLAARPQVAIPMMLSSILFVGSSLLFAGTSLPVLAVVIGVLSGLGMVISDVVGEVAITRAAGPDVRGRIFGAVDGICVAAMVLGALVAPPTVSLLGLRGSLLVLGGAAVVSSLACYPVLRGLDRLSTAVADALAPRLAAMAEVDVFNGAPQRALEEMAGSATEVDIPAGTAVVREGEEADAFYVIVSGELQVTSAGELGAEPVFLRTLAAGGWFGEIGLLEGIPRTATVTATTDVRVLRIPAESFLSALTAAPTGFGALREGATRRLARTHPSLVEGPTS